MADAHLPCRRPISGTDRTLTYEPASWPNWPTGPWSAASATRWSSRPRRRPARSGRGRTSSPSPLTSRSGPMRPGRSRFFFAGRAGDRPGHLDLPAHRPAAPAVVPEGLPQRGPRGRDDLRADQVKPARRARDQRRVGASCCRASLDGPIGAVRVAYSTEAPGSRTPPTRRATSRPSSWWSPAARCRTRRTPRSPS